MPTDCEYSVSFKAEIASAESMPFKLMKQTLNGDR